MKSDFRKVPVNVIQQDIPLSPNCCRRNKEGNRLAFANPLVSEAAKRFVSVLVPVRRKSLEIQLVDCNVVRNLTCDRNKVIGPEIWFQINKGLNGGKSQ